MRFSLGFKQERSGEAYDPRSSVAGQPKPERFEHPLLLGTVILGSPSWPWRTATVNSPFNVPGSEQTLDLLPDTVESGLVPRSAAPRLERPLQTIDLRHAPAHSRGVLQGGLPAHLQWPLLPGSYRTPSIMDKVSAEPFSRTRSGSRTLRASARLLISRSRRSMRLREYGPRCR